MYALGVLLGLVASSCQKVSQPSVVLTCEYLVSNDLSTEEFALNRSEFSFSRSSVTQKNQGSGWSLELVANASGITVTSKEGDNEPVISRPPGKAYDTFSYDQVVNFFHGLRLKDAKVAAADWSAFFKMTTVKTRYQSEGRTFEIVESRPKVPSWLNVPPSIKRVFELDQTKKPVRLTAFAVLTKVNIQLSPGP